MKTIIWDVDDVLNDLMYSWFQEHRDLYNPDSTLKYQDITQNPPHEILGITINEYLSSLDSFRNSEKGRNLRPTQQILDWFRKDGAKFRHVALTARPKQTIPVLADWILHHFGDWIRTLSFIPVNREGEKLPIYDECKADFLKWLGKGDYFIDDSAENVKAAEEISITSFLFPQPWNNGRLTVEQIIGKISSSSSK